MKILTLRIKPMEPLLFRGPGEFDPSSRGVYSQALSLYLPRPSTIVGALISYLLIVKADKEPNLISRCTLLNSFNDYLECMGKALDSIGVIALRGPYLYDTSREAIYMPVRLGVKLRLVDYDQLCGYLYNNKDLLDALLEHEIGEDKLMRLKWIERELERFEARGYEILRTGVMLRDRLEAGRIAREGYLYTVRYVAYHENIELRFKVVLSESNSLESKEPSLDTSLNIGGERRIARIVLEHSEDRINSVLSEKRGEADSEYYLLLSPMPLKNRDVLQENYIGVLDIIGLGFSIARRRRKPLYPALLEGSILRVKPGKRYLEGLLHHGLYNFLAVEDNELKVLARMGYASAIPLIQRC